MPPAGSGMVARWSRTSNRTRRPLSVRSEGVTGERMSQPPMPDHGAQRRDAPPTRRTRRRPEGSQPGPLTRLVASVRGGRIRESLARTPGLILALAAVVGLLTGLFAVALIELVQVVQRLAFGTT